MHQYHLGDNEDEKDGELVVSKVFYQTQPRNCSSNIKDSIDNKVLPQGLILNRNEIPINMNNNNNNNNAAFLEYYNNNAPYNISFNNNVEVQNRESPPQFITNLVLQGDGSSFIHLPSGASKGK